VGGANIQIVHFLYHGYLEEEKNQWYIVSQLLLEQTIWQAWLLVFLPTKLSVLFKKNILRQSKIYKYHFENSNFWGMWLLNHVGHVTYSLINMLFISMGIFDDKLRPQILLVGTTANSPLRPDKGLSPRIFILSRNLECFIVFINFYFI
jgi:hypothetical protein